MKAKVGQIISRGISPVNPLTPSGLKYGDILDCTRLMFLFWASKSFGWVNSLIVGGS